MSAKSSAFIKVDQPLLRDHQKIDRDFFIAHKSVYDLFHAQATRYPEKTFAIFPEYDKVLIYRDLDREAAKRAAYFALRGISKGDRICLVLPTSPHFLTLYFAAFRQGVTVVPINPDLSPSEIAYIVSDSKAKAVFYSEQFSDKIQETKKALELGLVSFISVSEVDVSLPATDTSPADVDYTDEAVIIYTSGTTGKPKGAVLIHLNLLVDSKVISEWFRFTPDTRTLCILPLFHNNGQVITLLAPLSVGGSTVMVAAKTGLKSFWSLIAEHGVSWTSVMPAMLAIFLAAQLQRTDSTMVGIICGGQVLSSEVKTQFENTFGVPIFEGYGLTETTSFACFNRFPASERRPGSVGEPLPCNDILVLDDDGKEVPRGEEGELCIRGLNVMREYFGLDDINKKALRGGVFHSGDYGSMDADGYVYFRTRKDYLISKGGEKIYPSEVENVLFAHPAVDECAVVGIPDKLLGQDIVAFVKVNSACDPSDLRAYCEGKLASYKHPKEVIVVNELADLREIPKGPTNKVLYRVLIEYYNRRRVHDSREM